MVEGIVTDPKSVGTAFPLPSVIKNMLPPMYVNPLTKVTLLRDEQPWNALPPKYKYI